MRPIILCMIILCSQAHAAKEQYVFLTPIQEATIRARTEMPVKAVHKQLGESFATGEELIAFDDRVARADKDKAHKLLEKAAEELMAQQELFRERASSLASLIEAKAALAAARADVALARDSHNACHVLAPFDGRVVDVFIQAHETPTPKQELISIIDDSSLIGKVLVPSVQLKHLHIGDTATLTLKELDVPVEGSIHRIGASIDPASSTVKVEVLIPNQNGKLTSGMSGKIRFAEELAQ